MRKIIEKGCPFRELHEVFKFSPEELEKKRARLFPSGNTSHETLTTSIFLASLGAVKEYREILFSNLGIKKVNLQTAQLHVFTEISNGKLTKTNSEERPDGLIVITSGKKDPIIEWSCFVESKVGSNTIEQPQIDKYVDFAQSVGVDAIVTISNLVVTSPMDSPLKTRKRNFDLYHWSWTYLKVTASRLVRTNKVKDEDHEFILKELRRFFDEHKLLSNYTNMGAKWKESVDSIHLHQDKKIDATTSEAVVASYIQEEKDLSLQLTDRTGFLVELLASNGRREVVEKALQTKKAITSSYCLELNKQNSFSMHVDFASQTVTCKTRVEIPDGKAQAQTTSLVRLLGNVSGAADEILINAIYLRNKSNDSNSSLSQLSKERDEKEHYSILDKSFGDVVKEFEIKTVTSLGKDFSGTNRFVVRIELLAEHFLTQVMANLPEKVIKGC